MWPSWIIYFVLGFSITAVPGAIFFETIRRELADEKSVYKFLLGNFSGMLLIIICAWSGMALLIKNPLVENMFYLLCGLTLVYIGVNSIFQRIKKHSPKNLPYADYTTGVVLATLNPLSIIFWISLVGKISQDAPDTLATIINITSDLLSSIYSHSSIHSNAVQ